MINRKGLVALLGTSLLASAVNADELDMQLKNSQGIPQPFAAVKNISGATVGYDALFDATRIHPTQPNRLDIYSQIPGHDLMVNALPADDFSSVTIIVEGISLIQPVNATLETSFINEGGEFNGKNLNLDVYNIVGGVPMFQGTYDARSVTNGNGIPLTITTGHSQNIVFRPTPIISPVLYPARITSLHRENGTNYVGTLVSPGYTSVLQMKTNGLNNGTWEDVATHNIPFQNSTNQVIEGFSTPAGEVGDAYFRIKTLP
ncbi:MAG TPA: hypothetical protein P5205_14780 [Candidatus Paceibacterota bacterium]|nr:hypothetical protein [Verrucomicrobiota bacterium]HSA11626.1 hypothetical protein [Candidatus Paceibacterota bacterium]